MQFNNASAETSSCLSSDEAQRRSPPPPNEVGAAAPQLGALLTPTSSLRHLLSLQQPQNPTLSLWIDNTDETLTTRLPMFQFPQLASPLVQQYQCQSDVRSRMVFLQGVLDEALNICDDVESIMSSELEDISHTSTIHREAKQ